MIDILSCIKPISEQEFKNLVNIRLNNICEGLEKYNNSTLLSSINKDFLIKEKSFISFMEKSFDINKEKNKDKPLIIDFYLKDLDYESFNRLSELLDEEDKYILNKIKNNINLNTNYFIIEDKRLVPFFVKLSTRELFFITFYFTQLPITIWGNYELKFPTFYIEDEVFQKYKLLAEDNKLIL